MHLCIILEPPGVSVAPLVAHGPTMALFTLRSLSPGLAVCGPSCRAAASAKPAPESGGSDRFGWISPFGEGFRVEDGEVMWLQLGFSRLLVMSSKWRNGGV